MNERKYASDIYSSWAQGTYLYVKWAERHQINYYEMLVMYVLDTKGNLTQKAIGDYLGLPKQTINNVIRKWKAEGYAILKISEKDKREKQVELTEKGKYLAQKLLVPLYRAEEQVCKNIEEKMLVQMIETADLFNLLFRREMEKERENDGM